MKKVIVAIILIAIIAIVVMCVVNSKPQEEPLDNSNTNQNIGLENNGENTQTQQNTTSNSENLNEGEVISNTSNGSQDAGIVAAINSEKPVLYFVDGGFVGYFHNNKWFKPNDIKLKYLFDNPTYTVYTENHEKKQTNKLLLSLNGGMDGFNYEGSSSRNKADKLESFGTARDEYDYVFELPNELNETLRESYTVELNDDYVSRVYPYIGDSSGNPVYDCLITYNGNFDIDFVKESKIDTLPDDVKRFVDKFIEKNGIGTNINYVINQYFKSDINNDGYQEEIFSIQSKDINLMKTTTDYTYQTNFENAEKEFNENGSFSLIVLKSSEAIETFDYSCVSLDMLNGNNKAFMGETASYILTIADLNKDGIFEILCQTSGWEYSSSKLYVLDNGNYVSIKELDQNVEHGIAKVYYDTNKKFIYLINNTLFMTRTGNRFTAADTSKITLSDLFENKAFYSLDNNAKKKYINTIIVNKFLGLADDNYQDSDWTNNESWFNRVQKALGTSKEQRVYEDKVDNLGLPLKAEKHEYKLPVYVDQSNKMDYKTNLDVYGASLEVSYDDFVSNDANLEMLVPQVGNTLSTQAQEYFDKYVRDNQLVFNTQPEIFTYTLNVDEDSDLETVYLIHSTTFDEFNFPDNYVMNEDLVTLLIVENQDKVFAFVLSQAFMRSETEEVFYSSLFGQDWKTDLNLYFADFDHDGSVEILVKGKELQPEPFMKYELYSIKGNKFSQILTFEGPNE
jgi:hypothetical protein